MKKEDNKNSKNTKFKKIDKARRRISHFYQSIQALEKTDTINLEVIKSFVTPDQVYTFLEVIEPLEKAKGEREEGDYFYYKDSFDFFKEHFPDYKKHYLQKTQKKAQNTDL